MNHTWQDYPRREDLKNIPAMVAKGWEPVFDKADIEVGRITPTKIPYYDVSFKKGDKVVVRNKKRGQWHGRETLPNGDMKFTLYHTLNDVLYGTSII